MKDMQNEWDALVELLPYKKDEVMIDYLRRAEELGLVGKMEKLDIAKYYMQQFQISIFTFPMHKFKYAKPE